MMIQDWVPIATSLLSLILSAFVAYKTLLLRFSGKVWPAKRMVITHIDGIPSVGLACFIDNSGAKPGRLEHLRLTVRHRESASENKFFPILIRSDYNIFAGYQGNEWFPFSGMWLDPDAQLRKYVLFRPLNDAFQAQSGRYEVELETYWNPGEEWKSYSPPVLYEITEQVASLWNDPEADALQVNSVQIMESQYE
jgi:hypothetical protein